LKPYWQDAGFENFSVACQNAILRSSAFFNMKAGTSHRFACSLSGKIMIARNHPGDLRQ